MTNPKVHRLISDFRNLLADLGVPEEFCYDDQTFDQRCEVWLLHAVEQLENEIEAFVDEADDE